jgi:hypothetical protein
VGRGKGHLVRAQLAGQIIASFAKHVGFKDAVLGQTTVFCRHLGSVKRTRQRHLCAFLYQLQRRLSEVCRYLFFAQHLELWALSAPSLHLVRTTAIKLKAHRQKPVKTCLVLQRVLVIAKRLVFRGAGQTGTKDRFWNV